MQQLQWKEQGKEEDHKRWKDEVEEDINIIGINQAGNGQRLSGMEKDYIGS
jgi:hypothetical protein